MTTGAGYWLSQHTWVTMLILLFNTLFKTSPVMIDDGQRFRWSSVLGLNKTSGCWLPGCIGIWVYPVEGDSWWLRNVSNSLRSMICKELHCLPNPFEDQLLYQEFIFIFGVDQIFKVLICRPAWTLMCYPDRICLVFAEPSLQNLLVEMEPIEYSLWADLHHYWATLIQAC